VNYETLRLIRNILLRTFVIGLAIALILGVVTMTGWMTWMGLASEWFHTDAATLTPIILGFFVQIRFFLLFIVLAPALAIHWTLKKERPEQK
jgi:hypothetical protein